MKIDDDTLRLGTVVALCAMVAAGLLASGMAAREKERAATVAEIARMEANHRQVMEIYQKCIEAGKKFGAADGVATCE